MTNYEIVEKAVYDLCIQANTNLPADVFEKLKLAFENESNIDAKQALYLILKNAKMSFDKKMPLCQDTGQVLVFLKSKTVDCLTIKAIHNGIEKAYKENYYRKSVVKNALFDRTNTKTNTPCIIYTEPSDSDDLEINLLLKGAGCENVSTTDLLSPTASQDEIIQHITSQIQKAGSRGCPPYFLGIGIGGTMEYAGLLSKKALILKENIDEQHENFAEKLKQAINSLKIGVAGLGGDSTVVDIKILTDFTHIANMPCAITVNCHSTRHAGCTILKNGSIKKESNITKQDFILPDFNDIEKDYIKVHTSDIKKIKSLKEGQKILLSGEIYTARDMAHKRLVEMIKNGEKLPLDLQDKIIFYAGPCPCKEPCIVGSIGPTTASRMDKFTPIIYSQGVLATIGKGERSADVKKAIKHSGGLYFTTIGGIACYLQEKFTKKELIAFEDLGTESICKFEVEEFPLRVEFC